MELEKNNNMDEQVKSKFADFAPHVPTDLWDKIETQLDPPIQPTKIKPVKRLRRAYSIYGGAVAATLIVAFAFWKFNRNETIELKRSAEVYAIEAPSEGNKSEPQGIGGHQISQEVSQKGLGEVNPISAIKKPVKVAQQVTPISHLMEENLASPTSVVSAQLESESNTVHAESSFSFSVAEAPVATQDVHPLEESIIDFEENNVFKVDVQDSLEEMDKLKNKKIGVSTVLNFLAKGLSNENGKSIEFSESEDGILKIDLKLGLAKGND